MYLSVERSRSSVLPAVAYRHPREEEAATTTSFLLLFSTSVQSIAEQLYVCPTDSVWLVDHHMRSRNVSLII